jgi:hypothetical protein
MSVLIQSECVHCGKAMNIQVDGEMNFEVKEADASPLIFEPKIDWDGFDQPNIIHAY